MTNEASPATESQLSRPVADAAKKSEGAPEAPLVEVELKKHRPQCTGMFWRSDPTGETMLQSNANWPRDNAKLRGSVVEVDGQKWLLAKQVQQKGSDVWHDAPIGAAMPFEYEDHYYLE